ncbi:MAG: transposase [bacterium]
MRRSEPRRNRRSIRLPRNDYTRPGAYFITICAFERRCLFGDIGDERVALNEIGEIVRDEWLRTGKRRSTVELDAFVVMPNHIHGIIAIRDDDRGTAGKRRGAARRASTAERYGRPVSGSAPTIVRSFKSAVTKRVNELRGSPGAPVWQRNYFERAVRGERELGLIREYIDQNPLRWAFDRENPVAENPPFDPAGPIVSLFEESRP